MGLAFAAGFDAKIAVHGHPLMRRALKLCGKGAGHAHALKLAWAWLMDDPSGLIYFILIALYGCCLLLFLRL